MPSARKSCLGSGTKPVEDLGPYVNNSGETFLGGGRCKHCKGWFQLNTGVKTWGKLRSHLTAKKKAWNLKPKSTLPRKVCAGSSCLPLKANKRSGRCPSCGSRIGLMTNGHLFHHKTDKPQAQRPE